MGQWPETDPWFKENAFSYLGPLIPTITFVFLVSFETFCYEAESEDLDERFSTVKADN